MGRPGNLSSLKTNLEVWTVPSLWTGAGAADLTKVLAPGVTSVVYQSSTGKFLVNFQDVGGQLIDVIGKVHNATGTAPLQVEFTPGTFSIANKQVNIEFYDTATPSLANPAASSKVSLTFVFAKNAT